MCHTVYYLMSSIERVHSMDAHDPREKYFSKNDLIVLRRGLETLWEMLSDLPLEKLPTAILLPDTSMRPLAHAIMPIINDVYRKREIPLPTYQFVVTHATKDFLFSQNSLEVSQAYWEEVYGELSTPSLETLKEELKKVEQDGDQKGIHYFEGEIKSIPMRAKQHREAWIALRDRLYEICKHAQRNNTVRLLIIDDYVRKGRSLLTINGLLASFNEEPEEFDSPPVFPVYFSFYHGSQGREVNTGIDKDELSATLIGPYVSASDRHTPHLDKNYVGFRFCASGSFNPEKTKRYKQENVRHIGYEKSMGEKYAKRSSQANSRDMRELRSFMREEAQHILDNR